MSARCAGSLRQDDVGIPGSKVNEWMIKLGCEIECIRLPSTANVACHLACDLSSCWINLHGGSRDAIHATTGVDEQRCPWRRWKGETGQSSALGSGQLRCDIWPIQ